MAVTPKSSWPWVNPLLGAVFDQPDAESVHAQFDRVLDALAAARGVGEPDPEPDGVAEPDLRALTA